MHLNLVKVLQNTTMRILMIDFHEVDHQYPEKLNDPHNYFPFLHEKIKTGKVENVVANLHNKREWNMLYT